MTATITLEQQNLVIDNVTDVVITEIQQDTTVGDYVRDIRIYGDLNGTDVLVVQVKVRSSVREEIELTAPASEY